MWLRHNQNIGNTELFTEIHIFIAMRFPKELDVTQP